MGVARGRTRYLRRKGNQKKKKLPVETTKTTSEERSVLEQPEGLERVDIFSGQVMR